MGRPKGSKNKVKRTGSTGSTGSTGRGPGRPPMVKRGRPAGSGYSGRGRPRKVRVMAAQGRIARAPKASFVFNPIDWMPLITELVSVLRTIKEIWAKENEVAPTPAASSNGGKTSPSFAKAVADKAVATAAPVATSATGKKRGRPKKETGSFMANKPTTASAELQEEMELEESLDDVDLEEEFEEDPLDDGSLPRSEDVL